METYRIGPGYILMASSMSAPLSDWHNLGKTRGDVLLNHEPGNLSFTRTDQTGVARLSGNVQMIGQNANIQAPLLDHQMDTLLKANPYAVSIEESAKQAIGFSKGVSRLSPSAIVIVPADDYDELEDWRDSLDVVWLKEGIAHVSGPFTMTLPEGEDALESTAYEVTFQSLRSDGADASSMGYGSLVATSYYNPPVADFEADVTSGPASLLVKFTDLTTNSPTSWAWDFGDSGTSTAQNPQHTYTVAGTYTVKLTATNSDGSDTEEKVDYITVT